MQCGSLENQSIQSELREILNPQHTTWNGNKETVILPMMTGLGDRFVFPACTEIGQQVTNSDTAQSYLSTELLLDQSLILFAVTWYTGTLIHHPPRLGFFLNLNLLRMHGDISNAMKWFKETLTEYNKKNFPAKSNRIREPLISRYIFVEWFNSFYRDYLPDPVYSTKSFNVCHTYSGMSSRNSCILYFVNLTWQYCLSTPNSQLLSYSRLDGCFQDVALCSWILRGKFLYNMQT